nr:PLP-dependent aminotransferase family protein [uncultured Acidocella sp.]
MTNSIVQNQANFDAALLGLTLARGGEALHVQLAEALRRLILAGAPPGARLPPSRKLAQELSISRATVLTALDQLTAEGYLQGRPGAGLFVARDLPHLAPPLARAADGPAASGTQPVRPFHPGQPDMRQFPHAAWARHLEAAWRAPDPGLLGVPDRFGWPPLREAIAAHLGAWRGIGCSAGQIIVTSGATEALGLAGRLLAPGGIVHVEEPGHAPVRAQLAAAGLRCVAVPVDAQGLDPALLRADAAGVVVTPSRQYPLGMTLPAARRLALLDWAQRAGALVIEDDYDSEFRFTGQPLPALASLDRGARTLYIGSFSKLLSPGIRLGYMVVPAAFLPRLHEIVGRAGTLASLVPQPALARFMQSGEFATHLRRMRRLYAQRQSALREALAPLVPDWLVPAIEPSGMHFIVRFGPRLAGWSDGAVAAAAREAGLALVPLSQYFHEAPPVQGLLLGFAGFEPGDLRAAASRLGACLAGLGEAGSGGSGFALDQKKSLAERA